MFKYDTLASEHTEFLSDFPQSSAQALSFTQSGSSAAMLSLATMNGAPRLLTTSPADNTINGVGTTGVVVTLNFNEPMARGTGYIYVTDGSLQSYIDRATGKPAMRIVGDSDTYAIPISDSHRISVVGSTVQVHVEHTLVAGRSYSVVMAKGVLTDQTGTAYGGISSTQTLNFTPSLPGPTLVSYNLGDGELRSGKHLNVTLVFSEAIQTLNAGAFSVPNGSLTGFNSVDGGKTWTAVLSPNADILDSSNQLGLDGTKIAALSDGRIGNGNYNSGNYAVDTRVAAYINSTINIIDTGISASDLVTGQATQTISGTYTGTKAGDVRLELVINDVVINPANITIDTTAKTWSYVATTRENINTVKASFVDSLGHNSAIATLTFDVDTAGPMLTNGVTYTGVNHAGDLVLEFNEAVHWSDSSKIQLVGNSATVEIGYSQVSVSNDKMTLTIPSALHQMIANTPYTLNLPASMTDAAGNSRGNAVVNLDTTPDVTRPTSALAKVTSSDGTYNVGDVVNITVTFNETVKVVGAPTLLLETGATDRNAVYVSGDGSTDLVFSYTVQAGDTAASLALASSAGLVGMVRDLVGNAVDAPSITFTGLEKVGGGAPALLIDGIAPTPMQPVIDSGVIKVQFAENITFASGSLFVYNSSDVLVHTYAYSGGNWSIGSGANGSGSLLSLTPQFAPDAYTLSWSAGAITDLSGNAAIALVGTAELVFATNAI